MQDGGLKEKIVGRVKEAVGSLIDDDDLKNQGRADQAAGKTKEKADELIDKTKEKLTGEKGSSKNA